MIGHAVVRLLVVRETGPADAPKPRLRLHVRDVDFTASQIVVRGGKGDKDRVPMLPAMAKADLARHPGLCRSANPTAAGPTYRNWDIA